MQQPPGGTYNQGTLAASGGRGIPGVGTMADAHPTSDPQPW